MKKNLIVPELSVPEKILWAASAVGVTVLFCLVPQKNPLTLIATIVGVTSLLFTAKGHVSGQFLQLVFCVLYAIVALGFKYYGEAITYMGMTFPSDLFAAIVWLKNPSQKGKNEVRMAHLTPKKSAVAVSVSTAATVIFYFILKKLNTANLEISTLSVFTSMAACVLTIMRVPYYALKRPRPDCNVDSSEHRKSNLRPDDFQLCDFLGERFVRLFQLEEAPPYSGRRRKCAEQRMKLFRRQKSRIFQNGKIPQSKSAWKY